MSNVPMVAPSVLLQQVLRLARDGLQSSLDAILTLAGKSLLELGLLFYILLQEEKLLRLDVATAILVHQWIKVLQDQVLRIQTLRHVLQVLRLKETQFSQPLSKLIWREGVRAIRIDGSEDFNWPTQKVRTPLCKLIQNHCRDRIQDLQTHVPRASGKLLPKLHHVTIMVDACQARAELSKGQLTITIAIEVSPPGYANVPITKGLHFADKAICLGYDDFSRSFLPHLHILHTASFELLTQLLEATACGPHESLLCLFFLARGRGRLLLAERPLE
mmetsp:Transcript_12664/g.29741  ORF Transcript_12664/g.29741 Transcript_12664/m.29741 type:complete len:275 (-) Transcript_12664:4576-5400(-)